MTDQKTTSITQPFNAEIDKVLHLMINSLYTNRDIFLRELISNASDALDKLRYLAVTDAQSVGEQGELSIDIHVDQEKKILTISDNGIGMNREDLIQNLGTIAHSGTKSFAEALSGNKDKDVHLIGQFGVGFYSSFMAADHVTVRSCKAGDNQGWEWQSEGKGGFTITELADTVKRGTSISLHLRENMDEYLDKHRVRHIVTTYSDHIPFPITFTEEEGKKETLNSASALWTKPKAEIKEEEYTAFYHHLAHAGDTPWLTLHNKVEGNISYINLLFIPSTKPFDLFHPDRKTRVKLYVKRVYITDDSLGLIPAYLRFVRGIIDSEDLPLNISRETLQHNSFADKIKRSVVKKVLNELKEKAKNDNDSYITFWENFGAVLKEGLCEPGLEMQENLLDICKFSSTHALTGYTSLHDYIERMKPGQDKIYYLLGDSVAMLRNSPQLEAFRAKDIEVLLLNDHVDDFWVNVVSGYKEKEFHSITRANIDLDNINKTDAEDDTDKKEENNEQIEKLIAYFKTQLGEKISDVCISHKLTSSAVCLSVKEGGMDIRIERFLLDQKQLHNASAKILEINPKHAVITKLAQDLEKKGENPESSDVIKLLFDQACISEGEPIQDVHAFSVALGNILNKALIA